MKPYSFFTYWACIGFALVLAVIYLSLTSATISTPQFEFADKISHLVAYASLTGWFSQLYTKYSTQLWFFLAFCAMGVGLEFVQGMGGVRMFEYADMVANALGAALGWWLSRTLLKGSLLKVDHFLSAKINSAK